MNFSKSTTQLLAIAMIASLVISCNRIDDGLIEAIKEKIEAEQPVENPQPGSDTLAFTLIGLSKAGDYGQITPEDASFAVLKASSATSDNVFLDNNTYDPETRTYAFINGRTTFVELDAGLGSVKNSFSFSSEESLTGLEYSTGDGKYYVLGSETQEDNITLYRLDMEMKQLASVAETPAKRTGRSATALNPNKGYYSFVNVITDQAEFATRLLTYDVSTGEKVYDVALETTSNDGISEYIGLNYDMSTGLIVCLRRDREGVLAQKYCSEEGEGQFEEGCGLSEQYYLGFLNPVTGEFELITPTRATVSSFDSFTLSEDGVYTFSASSEESFPFGLLLSYDINQQKLIGQVALPETEFGDPFPYYGVQVN